MDYGNKRGTDKTSRALCLILTIAMFFCIVASFAGCKKVQVDNGLVGTWEHMLGAVGGRWTFYSNGKCTHTAYSYTDAFGTEYSYEASNGVLTIYGIYGETQTYRYLLAISNGRQCLTLNGDIYYKIG